MKYAMQDGRIYTDWRPSCSINYDLQKKYNIHDDTHEYRYFLQRNAKKIISDLKSKTGDCILCPVCSKAVSYKPKKYNINHI